MNKVTLIEPDQCDDWILKDGMIRHRTGRYFSICKLNGQPFIDQPEIGLLGWVKDWLGNYIAQMKFEPGNIGDTQVTCTVQATLSNIERVHGGKEQPFVEEFMHVGGVIQSEQGSRYWRKKNRNATVKVMRHFEIPIGWTPISPSGIRELLLRDFSVTSDGRSALVSGDWDWCGLRLPDESDSYPTLGETTWPSIHSDVESKNLDGVVWVSVNTDSREVQHWEQPLLANASPQVIELWWNGTEVGLSIVDEPGLKWLSFGPSSIHAPPRTGRDVIIETWQSEEGGRFWKELNLYQIVRKSKSPDDGKFWADLGVLQAMCRTPMRTTIELRSAVSVLLAHLGKSYL